MEEDLNQLFGWKTDEPVYNYYSIVNNTDSAKVLGMAGSGDSLVSIYTADGLPLQSGTGSAEAISALKFNDHTYLYFRVEAKDGSAYRIYKLMLRHTSDNADLQFVGADNNIGSDNGSSGGAVVGTLDWSTETTGHYTVNLPGVTYITDLTFITVEPTATIEILEDRVNNVWSAPSIHEKMRPGYNTGGAESNLITVRVTAPNGFQKIYDVVLLSLIHI